MVRTLNLVFKYSISLENQVLKTHLGRQRIAANELRAENCVNSKIEFRRFFLQLYLQLILNGNLDDCHIQPSKMNKDSLQIVKPNLRYESNKS